MPTFSTTRKSEIVVAADRSALWDALTAPAVVTAMNATLQRTGDRFTANLLRHLDAAPRWEAS